MCGEHFSPFEEIGGWLGSPPHVRRTLQSERNLQRRVGITSACAENTRTVHDCLCYRWDHLRMCGEHKTLEARDKVGKGSPPHVRRTRV